MATPLHSDGRTVNLEALPGLIDFLAQRNVRGIFVGGTTGEGLFLDVAERLKLHEAAVNAAADLPVLLHVGANDTPTTKRLIEQAVDLDVAAIVIIPPTFLAMNDNHLVDYLAEVAAGAPDTPLLVYDIPQAAINGVTPRMVELMEAGIPSFAGLKCSRLDAQVIRALLDTLSQDRIFLAGNERIAVGSLMMGATGMISGAFYRGAGAIRRPDGGNRRRRFSRRQTVAPCDQPDVGRDTGRLPRRHDQDGAQSTRRARGQRPYPRVLCRRQATIGNGCGPICPYERLVPNQSMT